MSLLRRHFLGWDRPVLESTVDFLARDWEGSGLLDLSDHLVVVPTRQAGRRLREALARRAANAETAVLPPRVVTPNHLFSPSRLEGDRPVASPEAARLVWTALLLRLPLENHRRVFPVDPPERSLEWASAFAGQLLEVRDTLIESALDFGAAAIRLGEAGLEPARWQELARIEAAALALFDQLDLVDPGSAAVESARREEPPGGARQVVVAGVLDLRPLAAEALRRLSTTLPVHLLVSAPPSEADAFDEWGRPIPSAWLGREIRFTDPEGTLHPCHDPLAQADRCLSLLSAHPAPAACAGIGLPDSSLVPTFGQRFAAAGLGTYDPAGRPLSREGIHHLLGQLHKLVVFGRYEVFRQWLRCPGVIEALKGAPSGEGIRSGEALRESDRIAADHFPGSLDDAIEILRRNPGQSRGLTDLLQAALTLIRGLEGERFGAVLREFLVAIHQDRRLSKHDPTLAVLSEVAEALLALEDDLARVGAVFPRPLRAGEKLALLLDHLGVLRLHPERGPRDLDLQGWLELPWDDAPHLLVAGLNDHAVPESIVAHAFLPDTARRLLGVPDNESRFARDACLLTVLAESRRQGGRLDLLFGRFSESGEPLRPSRLLFQCQDGELASRTLRLFQGREETPTPPARTVAWRLRPRPLPDEHSIFHRISVTGFKSYLTCPFRYYLRQGLRMEKVEPGSGELDARAFGNLIHAALESYGRDPSLSRSTDAAEIAHGLEAALDRWLDFHHGDSLSTPLLIQREAARRRLRRWADVEAANRAAGWEILEVESTLGQEETGGPFTIHGMTVSGRIDRIERHPVEGLRVIDFKTFSPMENGRPKTVDHFHLASLKRHENPAELPSWMLTQNAKGKVVRWVDLQVPLYHLALSRRFPGVPVAAGYATLGRTREEIRLDLWENLDPGTLASAAACAAGVVDSIRRGVFWPPNERMPDWDEFHELLAPTPDETVDPAGLQGALPSDPGSRPQPAS